MDAGNGINAERGAVADGLPDDAVVEILSRVPARSIHRFKCVSKIWRDLIADPLNRKRLPQTLEGFFCSVDTGADFHVRFVRVPGRSAPFFDPSVSFLAKVPGIENLKLSGSCNGLVLFEHGSNGDIGGPGYAVCNPATEQWVTVPSSDCPLDLPSEAAHTYLIFDPAVSRHFQLVHMWQEDHLGEIAVRAFSSESRVWSDRASQQNRWQDEGGWKQWVNGGAILSSIWGSAFVNGMLHLVIYHIHRGYLLAAVDMEGKMCRIITWPDQRILRPFVGQSQGHLHCACAIVEREENCLKWAGLSIWVLEDYDTEGWVLKHRMSFLELFGQMYSLDGLDFIVLAIHPDRNLIFIQHSNQKLMSYDMDSKELHAFHTRGHYFESFTPYVPSFMEPLVLTNEH